MAGGAYIAHGSGHSYKAKHRKEYAIVVQKMKRMLKYKILFLCMAVLCAALLSPVQAQAAFNKEKAKKNVTVTYKKLPDGVLAVCKNKNKDAVRLTAGMSFLDGEKKSISKEKQTNLCLEGKSTAAFFFHAPRDEYGNPVNYSSYKGSYSVAKSKYKGYHKKISISTELDVIEGRFVAVNLSGKTLSSIHATIVFYDGSGEILGCCAKYLNCYGKNEIDQFGISYVGEMPQPSRAKVYIDWAY